MAISKLRITNFKGVREEQEFEIRPITLFIGPNSSGKSSSIHAIAALAQTAKLPTSGRPLVLDDEYAHVHLGRFIEVIHSKSYSDAICIGFDSNSLRRVPSSAEGAKKGTHNPFLSVDYSFKSTKRTQDVFLQEAVFKSTDATLAIKKEKNSQALYYNEVKQDMQVISNSGLFASLALLPKSAAAFDAYFYAEACNQAVKAELSKVLYLGPFRQSPLRRYPTRGSSPNEVGAQGENAVTLLANEYVQSKARKHLKQVGKWLSDLGLAKAIEVARVGKSDLFDVQATLADGANLPISDLGYGVSQILPVLTQFTFATEGATLLFEQPELHLHQSAAKQLAGVFVDAVKEKKIHIVAETHARELFYGLLEQVRLKRISADQIVLYSVKREGGRSVFTPTYIEVDADGRPEVYDPWGEGL